MSDEQVAAFADAVQESAALQAEIEQLGDDKAGIIALGRREGFDFTSDELAEYMERYQAEVSRELRDEELEEVAGGENSFTCDYTCCHVP